MKKALFLSTVFVFAVACSSSSNTPSTTAGIKIQGVVSSVAGAVVVNVPKVVAAGEPLGCPDGETGGVAINLTPQEGSFKIATRYVHLLKEGGDDYYSIPACEHSSAADAEAAAVTLSNSATTICEISTDVPVEAVGTYDGMEMAIYYVQMTVQMIVPQISADAAYYPLRIYFNDDTANGILARDILIYDETAGKWGWVDWDDTDQLAYIDTARPGGLLDAFANDNYWCADCAVTPGLCPAEAERRACSAGHPDWSYRDPVTISTRDDSGGTNFTLEGLFTIASISEAHVVSMAFDLANTLTAWENAGDIGDTDHKLDITRDCGFHPLFPSVTITESKE